MNNRLLRLTIFGLVGALLAGQSSVARAARGKAGQAVKDEFFLVSSLNAQKHEILLDLPTEVTLQMTVTDKTSVVDERGKPMRLSDLRAGDTAYVSYTQNGSEATATSIRLGSMTLQELRRRYLNEGATALPTPAAPGAPSPSVHPQPERVQRGRMDF